MTVGALAAALARRDVTALCRVLDPDVVLVGDGGGQVVTPLRPVSGSEPVAAFLTALVTSGSVVEVEAVNGRLGLVVRADGGARAVLAFAMTSSVVTQIWLVLNPGKLGRWNHEPRDGVR
ncbi:MAG TPA: hypothetical protein VFL38_08390 [Humibacillus xanthopallidus]|nr:hypothetical protein [Humibacillus xanthopallidus]